MVASQSIFANGVSTSPESTLRNVGGEWEFRQVGTNLWRAASVPGTVHTDLLRADLIPDPYYRVNERYVQWVDKCDWEYRTQLNLTAEDLACEKLELLFEGLDTYADVRLNGELLLSADNMFREWEVSIKDVAHEGDNELAIYFHSPINKGLELYYNYPIKGIPSPNDQTDNGGLLTEERVGIFERKAPYHFGWDWGPRIVTSGVCRPIYLIAQNSARLTDVYFEQSRVTKRQADLRVEASVSSVAAVDAALIEVVDRDSRKVLCSQVVSLSEGDNTIELNMKIRNPELWWTAGLGDAHLYRLDTRLSIGGEQKSVWSERIGLRSLRLVEQPDPKGGMSLYFEINGVPIFTKGANHIPNDMFVDRMSREVYENEIANAVDANMNMLRVWGGGIYENDYFYELCDENGILVWQDFMFACSMYPDSQELYESIRMEAIDNVKRLRNHASIALWCGNNEVDIAWSMYDEYGGWGWKKLFTESERETLWRAYTTIFKEILADVVAEYDPLRSYRHSSPITHTPNTHSGYSILDEGDIHYWDVWHGRKPIEDFHNVLGRYMSEYGFQAFPEMRTIEMYAQESDFSIDSPVMLAHQRSPIGNEAISEYMDLYYNTPDNFEDYIYLQQQLQADAIAMAIEAHRHNMPHTMGSLYWQINDCWPVASWSSTDYYRRWKALHYAVRRAFEPLLITYKFVEGDLVASVVSDRLTPIKGVEFEIVVLNTQGEQVSRKVQKGTIAANNVTSILRTSKEDIFTSPNDFIVIRARVAGEQIAQGVFFPTKVKDMTLPAVEPTFAISQVDDSTVQITISAEKLVKSLRVELEGVDGFFSDNYFTILAGESHTITFSSDEAISAEELMGKIKYQHITSISYNE